MKKFFAACALLALTVVALPVQAQRLNDGLGDAREYAGYNPSSTLEGTIGATINVLLSFLGVIFLIITVYAGFLWMTAGGNDKQIKKAKDLLINAVIGLIILLSAYAITTFVINNIGGATNQI